MASNCLPSTIEQYTMSAISTNITQYDESFLLRHTFFRVKWQQTYRKEIKLKENVSLRVPAYVKEILEEIAAKEYRPLANVMEKLIVERLRDLGFLDEKFQAKRKKGKG